MNALEIKDLSKSFGSFSLQNLTLTVPMIARSKHTWVFTSEVRKADAVAAAFAQRNNPHAPSSYADGEELLWLIDKGAASRL